MTYVIGQHSSAVDWCRGQGINPRGRDVVIISDTHSAVQLRGRIITDEDTVQWVYHQFGSDTISEIASNLRTARGYTL